MRKKLFTSLLIFVLIISISMNLVLLSKTNNDKAPNNSIVLTLTEQKEPIAWNNLKITVGQQDGPGDYVSIPNHSEITNKQLITLPIGQATMIRFLHGGSAVNPLPDKIIYWIYIQKPIHDKPDMMKTYYIEGEVIGDNEQQAKEEFIQIAQNWKIDK